MNNGFGLVFLNFAHEAFFIIVRSLDSGSLETMLYQVDLIFFSMFEVRIIIHLQGNCAFMNQTFPSAIDFSMVKRTSFVSEIIYGLTQLKKFKVDLKIINMRVYFMIAVAGWYTDEVSIQGTPRAISHEFMGFLKYVYQMIKKAFTGQLFAHLLHNIRRIFLFKLDNPQKCILNFIFLDKFVKALAFIFEKKSSILSDINRKQWKFFLPVINLKKSASMPQEFERDKNCSIFWIEHPYAELSHVLLNLIRVAVVVFITFVVYINLVTIQGC
jgi:hypothetical protein